MAEHAVIVRFDYQSTSLDDLFELQDQLERAIAANDVGEYDGNEISVDGSSGGTLYMDGPDADVMFRAVKGALAQATAIQNATATLRHGPPEDGVREIDIKI